MAGLSRGDFAVLLIVGDKILIRIQDFFCLKLVKIPKELQFLILMAGRVVNK